MPVDVWEYQMAIGCLTYATVETRPDLATAVATLSKYMSRPGKDHWQAVKRVFSNIKGMIDYGILFIVIGEDSNLYGFSDADDVETKRSTLGYFFRLKTTQ